MSRLAAGALVGLGLSAALMLLAQHAFARRRPSLAARIGPYVGALRSSVPPTTPRTAWLRWPAGRTPRAPAYRVEQLAWGATGASLGALLGMLLAARGAAPAGVVVLGVIGGVGGIVARDAALARQTRRRRDEVEASLPTLADLVALAVTSGCGPVAALERAAAAMTGPLADDIGAALAEIRSGAAADAALRAMSVRIDVPAVGRLVDALLLSAERGSPLAEVARAHALDVRAAERRRLLELAGRKDVLMLVPIVLLVLPSVVIVAAFPGLAALRLVVP